MALDVSQQAYVARNNDFFREHYHHVLLGVMLLIIIMIAALSVVFYQIYNRPHPQFNAVQPDGKKMLLIPYDEPNLRPDTILRWASKAATVAYTFDFVNYNQQIAATSQFFTPDGWLDYQRSVSGLIQTIRENQLIINGVVSGAPVISNEGPLPGKGYVWRIQIPFLVTYQTGSTTTRRNYFVVLSIVRVPTSVNRQGIGIDQFVMV